LRAAGEATRLRILALLAIGELNVKDLTQILGQSQPRISRHLKLMAEAGLIKRFREGSWVFFRPAESGAEAVLANAIVESLDPADLTLARDRARAEAVILAAPPVAKVVTTLLAGAREIADLILLEARRGEQLADRRPALIGHPAGRRPVTDGQHDRPQARVQLPDFPPLLASRRTDSR
jgi:DNA-binding transcriptional ArsR family regulator